MNYNGMGIKKWKKIQNENEDNHKSLQQGEWNHFMLQLCIWSYFFLNGICYYMHYCGQCTLYHIWANLINYDNIC